MALRINTNLSVADCAQRNLNDSTKQISDSFRKLSSGLRIQRASDDADRTRGLRATACAECARWSRHAATPREGISLAQTAEGALDEISVGAAADARTRLAGTERAPITSSDQATSSTDRVRSRWSTKSSGSRQTARSTGASTCSNGSQLDRLAADRFERTETVRLGRPDHARQSRRRPPLTVNALDIARPDGQRYR